jgi:hypothetical protein
VDYVCPFSAKMARALDGVLKPLVDAGGPYAGKLKVIFRPQVQPWHASSTLVHEAGIAVARTAPEAFWPFSLAVCSLRSCWTTRPDAATSSSKTRRSTSTFPHRP